MSFGSGDRIHLGTACSSGACGNTASELFTAAVQRLVENFFFSFSSENPKSFLDNYNRFININKSYINRKKKKTANTLISTAMQTKITHSLSYKKILRQYPAIHFAEILIYGKEKKSKKMLKVLFISSCLAWRKECSEVTLSLSTRHEIGW